MNMEKLYVHVLQNAWWGRIYLLWHNWLLLRIERNHMFSPAWIWVQLFRFTGPVSKSRSVRNTICLLLYIFFPEEKSWNWWFYEKIAKLLGRERNWYLKESGQPLLSVRRIQGLGCFFIFILPCFLFTLSCENSTAIIFVFSLFRIDRIWSDPNIGFIFSLSWTIIIHIRANRGKIDSITWFTYLEVMLRYQCGS